MATVFYEKNFRFFFYSKEETRKNIHVASTMGELKVWLEPEIEIANKIHLSNEETNAVLKIVKARKKEIDSAWDKHFGKN